MNKFDVASLKTGIQVDDCNQGLSLMELKQLVTPMMEVKRRRWVGLTHNEATELWEKLDDRDSWELLKQVEKKLKEKNGGND